MLCVADSLGPNGPEPELAAEQQESQPATDSERSRSLRQGQLESQARSMPGAVDGRRPVRKFKRPSAKRSTCEGEEPEPEPAPEPAPKPGPEPEPNEPNGPEPEASGR